MVPSTGPNERLQNNTNKYLIRSNFWIQYNFRLTAVTYSNFRIRQKHVLSKLLSGFCFNVNIYGYLTKLWNRRLRNLYIRIFHNDLHLFLLFQFIIIITSIFMIFIIYYIYNTLFFLISLLFWEYQLYRI